MSDVQGQVVRDYLACFKPFDAPCIVPELNTRSAMVLLAIFFID